MKSIACFTALLASVMLLSAAPIQFQSATNQTALLELYTSQGCSSCPPADTWLSQLKDSPKLWKDFVPVAFHVDYWDYLGWRDPFAAARYSERQHDYAGEWRSRSVYTPEFVLDGREWHGWGGRGRTPENSAKPAGVLTASSTNGTHWTLRFQPVATTTGKIEFHAALLGCELATDVKAGENRGRKLAHDFVALDFTTAPARAVGEGFEASLMVNSKSSGKSSRLAITVWVTGAKSLNPLQSAGGWLPGMP